LKYHLPEKAPQSCGAFFIYPVTSTNLLHPYRQKKTPTIRGGLFLK
jgi:hypothetical protein